jgi:hypothetical protein
MTISGEPRVLRVFVSSPSDLLKARNIAREAVERIDAEIAPEGRFRLVPLLWEETAGGVVGFDPQAAVDYYLGSAHSAQVYIGMFWTRLGSPVVVDGKRYDSGTVFEFDKAYENHERTGQPRMRLFRCMQAAPEGSDPESLRAVEAFFDDFSKGGGARQGMYETFHDEADLQLKLERVLRAIVDKIAEDGSLADPTPDDARYPISFRSADHPQAALIAHVERFVDQFGELYSKKEIGEGHYRFNMHFDAECDPSRPREPIPEVARETTADSLLRVYEANDRRLLLLGEAGSGKTFALLRVMQLLLRRAKNDSTAAVPVYFNLSSWVRTRVTERRSWFRRSPVDSETLGPWLVDELVRRSAIPRPVATRLVDRRQIIFCLDGLDELAAGARLDADDLTHAVQLREDCVRAINRTLKDPSTQMVLCCRTEAYRDLLEKPRLGFPLSLRALASQDIRKYLRGWSHLDGLFEALSESPLLEERARSPLILRMMATAYRNRGKVPILTLASANDDVFMADLLERYVNQCMIDFDTEVASRGAEPIASRAQVSAFLRWMSMTPGTDFLFEDIQPSMLSINGGGRDAAWKRLYHRLATGAMSVYLGLAVAIPCGTAIGVEYAGTQSVSAGIRHGFLVGLVTFALTVPMSWPGFASLRWIVFGIDLGVTFGIVRGVTIGLSVVNPAATSDHAPVALGGLRAGILTALMSIPFATLVFLLLGRQALGRIALHKKRYERRSGISEYEIQPLETLDWRWYNRQDPWHGGWWGMFIGPVIALSLWPWFGPARGFGFGIIVTLFVTVFSGLSGTALDVSLDPNQGIERSLRHAVLMTSLFTFAGVVAFGLSYGGVDGALEGIVNAILGLSLALCFLVFGGMPVIRHVCMGHVLHRQGVFPSWWGWKPWTRTLSLMDRLVRFKLLRRSAGGYTFRHQILRDYYRRGGPAD